MALRAGSPALDAGTAAGAPAADQRGVARTGGINLGAYQASASALVVGFPASVAAGTNTSFTVAAQDVYHQSAFGYRGTIHLSGSDPQALLPADYSLAAADDGQHAFAVTLKTAGPQSLTAADPATAGLRGTRAGIGVTPAAASTLSVTGFPASVTAGTAGGITVTTRDPFGNIATGYRGTVRFTSSDPQAVLPATYQFTAADQGRHTFSATLKTAGTRSLTATDSGAGALTGSQAGIVVSAAALDHFAVTTSADGISTAAGTPFGVTVVAQDAFNNTVTGYTGTVTFSSADPVGATLPADYTFRATDQGVAFFPAGAALYTAGTWDVTATDAAGGQAGSDFVLVTPAPAVAFQVIAPAGAASGAAFDVTVVAVDASGNIDTNYRGTVHFSTSDPDPGAVLPADYAFQLSDAGTVTFPGGVALVTPGGQALAVTDTASGLTGGATVTVGTPPGASPPSGQGASPAPAAAQAGPTPPAGTAALDLAFCRWGHGPKHRGDGADWALDPSGS
jgi:hypothetical protein